MISSKISLGHVYFSMISLTSSRYLRLIALYERTPNLCLISRPISAYTRPRSESSQYAGVPCPPKILVPSCLTAFWTSSHSTGKRGISF